jgi:CRISPR-associated protein Csb2
MLAIAVRYLTGRVVATHPARRDEAEWPPHPARLFMALVASWGENGCRPDGRTALEWLERQPAPELTFSAAAPADPVTVFVPVNDARDAKLLPSLRGKAGRQFPSVVPEDDTVWFVWREADPPPEIRAGLARLLFGMTYLGHSSTLVAARLDPEPPPATWIPGTDGSGVRLRVAGEGTFGELARAYAGGGAGKGPERPQLGSWQAYAPPSMPAREEAGTAGGGFSAAFWVLRRVSGRPLPLAAAPRAVEALRAAMIAHAEEPVPELISGHGPDGSPSRRPHVAFVPLADVGHPHADGHLLGLAVIPPAGLTRDERRTCAAALAGIQRLTWGRLGAWDVETGPPGAGSHRGLDTETWTRPARRWASVTPVVFDRYPKREGDAASIIGEACARIGLPRPLDVLVHPVSLHLGVPAAGEFPPLSASGKRRWHCHVVVTFAEPVPGPVLLGAGRFRGYGFLRPLEAMR